MLHYIKIKIYVTVGNHDINYSFYHLYSTLFFNLNNIAVNIDNKLFFVLQLKIQHRERNILFTHTHTKLYKEDICKRYYTEIIKTNIENLNIYFQILTLFMYLTKYDYLILYKSKSLFTSLYNKYCKITKDNNKLRIFRSFFNKENKFNQYALELGTTGPILFNNIKTLFRRRFYNHIDNYQKIQFNINNDKYDKSFYIKYYNKLCDDDTENFLFLEGHRNYTTIKNIINENKEIVNSINIPMDSCNKSLNTTMSYTTHSPNKTEYLTIFKDSLTIDNYCYININRDNCKIKRFFLKRNKDNNIFCHLEEFKINQDSLKDTTKSIYDKCICTKNKYFEYLFTEINNYINSHIDKTKDDNENISNLVDLLTEIYDYSKNEFKYENFNDKTKTFQIKYVKSLNIYNYCRRHLFMINAFIIIHVFELLCKYDFKKTIDIINTKYNDIYLMINNTLNALYKAYDDKHDKYIMQDIREYLYKLICLINDNFTLYSIQFYVQTSLEYKRQQYHECKPYLKALQKSNKEENDDNDSTYEDTDADATLIYEEAMPKIVSKTQKTKMPKVQIKKSKSKKKSKKSKKK